MTDLVFMSWIFDEPGRRDAMRAQFEGFASSQSKYRIRERQAPFSDYTSRVLSQLAGDGIAADVMMTAPELTIQLLPKRAFAPLDDVAKSLKILDRIRSGFRNDVSLDGQLHGFDAVSIGQTLLYNRQMYQAAAIKTPPTTPDEWVAVARQLTDRTNSHFGFYAAYHLTEAAAAWFNFQEFALPYDGKWADGKSLLLTSPEIVKGVQLFKSLYDDAFHQGVDAPGAWKLFTEGNLAHVLRESSVLNLLKTTAKEIYPHIVSAPVPWTTKKSTARAHPMHVVGRSKNQDGAFAWLSYLYQPRNYVRLTIDSLDLIPMYPIAKDTPGVEPDVLDSWNKYLAGFPAASGYLDQLDAYVSPTDLLGDFALRSDDLGQIVVQHLEDVLVRGADPGHAMSEAQRDAEGLSTAP
jgi:ABC-type glycerol-3-phosphate transport system substrate-binding protein